MITQRLYQTSAARYAWRHFLLLFALLIGLATPLQSYAAAHVAPVNAGKVIFVFGQAWRLGVNGGKYDIKRGTVVKVGDVIETSASGQVQIRMNDNGLISIRPSSEFKIRAFKYSHGKGADISNDKSYFQLFKGGFRSITGAVGEADHKHYKVFTPVATIGIRGTDYSARLCASDCARADGLYVGVWRGGISLTNNVGVLNVDAGQFGYVADASTQGQQVQNLPAGLLLSSTGVRAGGASNATDSTTLAELAAGDAPLTQPSVLSLPSTGTASYNLTNISGSGTDSNGGAVSVNGGSATVNANFSNMSASTSVALNMSNGSQWSGSASGMSLQNNGSFSGSLSNVSNTNDPNGNTTTGSGSVSGSLTGMGSGTVPTGANLSFNMTGSVPGGSVPSSVSGTANTP